MNGLEAKLKPAGEDRQSSGAELERKFWPAMAAYAILAVVAWFILGGGTVLIQGRPVEIRFLPLFVLGMLALRTALARQADRIRRGE
jgi:hypothetical protein